jgi:hypothetical protein
MSQTTPLLSLTRLHVSQSWETLPLHQTTLRKRERREDQNSVTEIRSKDLTNKINKRNRLVNLFAVLQTEKAGALRVANVRESTTEVYMEYLSPGKQKTLSQIVAVSEIFCI